jgi:hypothetical protein
MSVTFEFSFSLIHKEVTVFPAPQGKISCPRVFFEKCFFAFEIAFAW